MVSSVIIIARMIAMTHSMTDTDILQVGISMVGISMAINRLEEQ